MNKTSVISLFVISAFTLALNGKIAHAQSWFSSFWVKLDAHELGTWNYLERVEGQSIRVAKTLVRANDNTWRHRQEGQNHDHIGTLVSARCNMIQTINNFYGNIGKQNRNVLQMPKSLVWRSKYINELRNFSNRLKGYKFCSDVPSSILSDMYRVAQRYLTARERYIQKVESRNRSYRDQQWAGTLSAEIPGLPFKFEFLNGELKLKLSRKIGGISVDGLFGPTSRRSGVRLVEIISGRKIFLYEIGNRPITFEVPASTIRFNGDIVTITHK